MNGYRIKVTAQSAETFFVEEVIRGHADIQKIAAWIERHIKKA